MKRSTKVNLITCGFFLVPTLWISVFVFGAWGLGVEDYVAVGVKNGLASFIVTVSIAWISWLIFVLVRVAVEDFLDYKEAMKEESDGT